jgi:hypothetical protein
MEDRLIDEMTNLFFQPSFLGKDMFPLDAALCGKELEELLAEIAYDKGGIRLVAPESGRPALGDTQRAVCGDVEEVRSVTRGAPGRGLDGPGVEGDRRFVRPRPCESLTKIDGTELIPFFPRKAVSVQCAGDPASINGELEKLQHEALTGGLRPNQERQIAEVDLGEFDLCEVSYTQTWLTQGKAPSWP